MRLNFLLWMAIAASVFFADLPQVQAQNQCFKTQDCECLHKGKKLRNGLWQGSVGDGVGTSNLGLVFPFNAAEGQVQIVSDCDGVMRMKFFDEEIGEVDWTLGRINPGPRLLTDENSLLPKIEEGTWSDFEKISPEISEMANANDVYIGQSLISTQEGPSTGTMLFVYRGAPGNASESGEVSITVRIDTPTGYTIWLRSGRSDFRWVSGSDSVDAEIRKVCRCGEVESDIASAKILIKMQLAIMERQHGKKMRRVGYDNGTGTEGRLADLMFNENFDHTSPWELPGKKKGGNWPCVPVDLIARQDVSDQTQLAEDFAVEWKKRSEWLDDLDRRVYGKVPQSVAGSSGGSSTNSPAETDSETCLIKYQPKQDQCGDPEVVRESFKVHEEEHQAVCRSREDFAKAIMRDLQAAADGKRSIPGLTRDQASAYANSSELRLCLSYQGATANSYLAAVDELNAYTEGLNVLEGYHDTYCPPAKQSR